MPQDPGLTIFLSLATLGSSYTMFKLFHFLGPLHLRDALSKALCRLLCFLGCGLVSQVLCSFLSSV